MADNASRLAPKRSLRPLTRPVRMSTEAEEEAGLAALAAKRRAQAEYRDRDMRQLGNLEMRVDMEPYLAGDPLARLGFDPDRVDWFSPYGEVSAFYAPQGYDLRGKLPSEDMRRYDAMYPDRGGQVPEDTVMMNSHRPPAVLAHESRHRGIAALHRAGQDVLPMGSTYEEALVELGDVPYAEDTINLPLDSRAFERGARISKSVGAYIEHPNPPEGVLRYEQVLQELAQEELTRRGEPPKTQRREPEPEPGGVQRFLRSIFGGD